MDLQGVPLEILLTVKTIQATTSVETVTDVDIADRLGLNVQLVRSRLDVLAKEGYVSMKQMYPHFKVQVSS